MMRIACGCCQIVSPEALRRLGESLELSGSDRQTLTRTINLTAELRAVRKALVSSSLVRGEAVAPQSQVAATPHIQVFDCRHFTSLPGRLIDDSQDEASDTVRKTTAKLVEFYGTVLGRNGIEGLGADISSSVRYGRRYQNAFWNGQQMVYGDGDGEIFVDFWRSPDVIGHELSHGVTQSESGLIYEGQPGALNESFSDVVGACFNQWLNNWDVTELEGWLIGAGIMGPRAIGAGKTVLRDMADPGGAHCLSPQPAHYDDYEADGDVHANSGIPNKAFHAFATAIGKEAWGPALKTWYDAAIDDRLPPDAPFKTFAAMTLEKAKALGVGAEAKAAWESVGL